MARAFAFELGLPAAITLMDTQSPEGREEQAKLLANLTDPRRITKKARNDLLKALTLATHGQASKKSIETTLQTFLDHYAPTLRATARHWGDLTRAFPQGHPRPIADPSHRRQLLQTAQTSLQAEAPQIADRLLPTLRACAQFTPDHPLPKFEETLPKQLLTLLDPSQTTLTYNRKTYPLSQQTLTPIRALLTHLAATDLQRHARQTHGIALALEPYLQLESNHIIRTGRMTFDDLTRLLTLADATFTSAHPTLLEKRIYIDFRMDTRLDHYMLDEFQDTSDRQWQLLQPLISEVVTPPPGEKRSFFYVGDVKQSIYGWRGGNYHLFGQIHDQYRPWLTQRQLNQSFRSSPPVIQTINHAFDLTRLTQTTRQNLPPATLQFWQNQWQPHTISPKSKPRNGIAELITHPPGAPASDTIGDILRHLQSHGPKQLSIAILTRSNDQGAHLAQALKSQGFPIALEGNRDILDSPLIHLAISFLRAISHPADTAAWGHLLISPLAATYAPACGTPTEPGTQALRTAFSHTHLRHLHRHGLQNLLNNHLLPFLCPQTFTPHDTRRWRDLLRLARHADQNGDTDLDTFLRAIQSHTIQDTPTAGTIRIMTIHKSKGLGFNIVILPFPEHGESLSNPAPPPSSPAPTGPSSAPTPPPASSSPPSPNTTSPPAPTKPTKPSPPSTSPSPAPKTPST